MPATDSVAPPLAAWANFYVITGSAGAAFTGLMFVAIAVITQVRRGLTREGLQTFSTPTVVHLSAVIVISAVLSAPWPDQPRLRTCLGICGLAGVIYDVVVIRRFLRVSMYRPDREDWGWHAAAPFVSYMTLLLGALLFGGAPTLSLYLLAAAVLLLMLTGIHNAWDMVTYTTAVDSRGSSTASAGAIEQAPEQLDVQ